MPEFNEKTRWKGGRAPRKYCLTVEGLAKTMGRAVSTIRHDIVKGRLRLPKQEPYTLDASTILGIAIYIERYRKQ